MAVKTKSLAKRKSAKPVAVKRRRRRASARVRGVGKLHPAVVGVLVVGVAYSAWWLYNNVVKATDKLILGNIGFGNASFGGVEVNIEISNIGRIPITLDGITGSSVITKGCKRPTT